jgi:hypothetical protein
MRKGRGAKILRTFRPRTDALANSHTRETGFSFPLFLNVRFAKTWSELLRMMQKE